MRLALINLKGSTGKTTSAVYLAAALARRGKTLLVDANPQGSALSWGDQAEGLPFTVAALPVKTLHRQLPELGQVSAHVVVPEAEEPLVSQPEAVPSKPAGKGRIVRITLDLEATQHQFLKRLALEEELSVSDLLRAVVGMLEEDLELARRVAERARGGPSVSHLATMELEVPMSKITDYLLSSSHPVGRHKARYFMALGFQPDTPERLAEALKAQARGAEQVREERTEFGLKWMASGRLRGPSGTGQAVSVGYPAEAVRGWLPLTHKKGLVLTNTFAN